MKKTFKKHHQCQEPNSSKKCENGCNARGSMISSNENGFIFICTECFHKEFIKSLKNKTE